MDLLPKYEQAWEQSRGDKTVLRPLTYEDKNSYSLHAYVALLLEHELISYLFISTFGFYPNFVGKTLEYFLTNMSRGVIKKNAPNIWDITKKDFLNIFLSDIHLEIQIFNNTTVNCTML